MDIVKGLKCRPMSSEMEDFYHSDAEPALARKNLAAARAIAISGEIAIAICSGIAVAICSQIVIANPRRMLL